MITVIDNYDSFTYNLVQYFWELGAEIAVYRNDEKSVAEVASIVGIPEATVKTRMFYARKKLSELLKERGIDRGWP